VSEIVNLNKVRKAKARNAVVARAAENRAAFGLTKVQKTTMKARNAKVITVLDGHKRDD
jgi:hypothetical protein